MSFLLKKSFIFISRNTNFLPIACMNIAEDLHTKYLLSSKEVLKKIRRVK